MTPKEFWLDWEPFWKHRHWRMRHWTRRAFRLFIQKGAEKAIEDAVFLYRKDPKRYKHHRTLALAKMRYDAEEHA